MFVNQSFQTEKQIEQDAERKQFKKLMCISKHIHKTITRRNKLY